MAFSSPKLSTGTTFSKRTGSSGETSDPRFRRETLCEIVCKASPQRVWLVLFAIGLWLANLASSAIIDSGVAQAYVWAIAARVAILALVGAMALRAMGVANEIINLAFGLLLGSIAVASALAFGLGGPEVAARTLEEWSQSLKKQELRLQSFHGPWPCARLTTAGSA